MRVKMHYSNDYYTCVVMGVRRNYVRGGAKGNMYDRLPTLGVTSGFLPQKVTTQCKDLNGSVNVWILKPAGRYTFAFIAKFSTVLTVTTHLSPVSASSSKQFSCIAHGKTARCLSCETLEAQ